MPIAVHSPFPEHALPRLWKWQEPFRDRVNDDFEPSTPESFVAVWQRRVRTAPSWAISRDGELGGIVTFEKWSTIAGVLLHLFKPEFWDQQYSVPAMAMLFEQLRAEGVEKVSMLFFQDAARSIGIAKAMGGKREGVLEHHTKRHGKPAAKVAMGFVLGASPAITELKTQEATNVVA